MCFERLRRLKCGHFESYHFDTCQHRLGRSCPTYQNVVLQVDMDRSCTSCKAAKAASVGASSPAELRR